MIVIILRGNIVYRNGIPYQRGTLTREQAVDLFFWLTEEAGRKLSAYSCIED